MNMRFIGTLHGDCRSKKKSTKDYRRSPSLLVNKDLLIDLGAGVMDFVTDYGMSDLYHELRYILLTKTTGDRFCSEMLPTLAGREPLIVYGLPQAEALIPVGAQISFVPLTAGTMVDIGPYKVIPLSVGTSQTALSFAVSGDKTLWYAPDGGLFRTDTWQILKELSFDCIVLGCPRFDAPTDGAVMEENNLSSLCFLRDILRGSGIAKEKTRIFVTTLPTDKKRPLHGEIAAAAAENGMTAVYDGYYCNI